jgi:AhpD family alkylhydroperoxidase
LTFHEHTDNQFARHLRTGAPEAFKALQAFDHAAIESDAKVIPHKYTELIAVAVGLTTQCAYCIEAHSKAAQAAGASEAELAETVMIASVLRAGGAYAHGFMAMKFFKQAATEDTGNAVEEEAVA